ncbi:rhomboid family intramembrane serine protease [Bacillus sp. DTU_2020_1000418_1_SI_GHA_SEK_038]|uniref:rhomboid family intramembrane serine protease n=1 Tax=Bacillus sp. DTU_2020_1000418_1_SI_GHA_SEK_038 TaxID=3077585 RepID=UPI0028F0EDBC|nr:rhomboid family intramembrane serine protease [Bacillus sp. DTU_2020_1000418_1_SI_GHA_SEK_038]WNS74294.1 rhomboid family intramembrane serine protease [Bacillus sp. DTU_2020_1000418_1_SI_GHA_SEK_038]
MNLQEDYLFWKLAHYFISEQNYRIVQLAQQQNELWLEKMENKEAQVIRLLKYNLDWSNWMQKDIEHTALNGERIRKQLMRGEMNVINIYISAYPPVDDYEYRIEKPFILAENKKTMVTSIIFDRSHYEESFTKLNSIFQGLLPILINSEGYTWNDIEKVKLAALSEASNRHKKEQALFQYGKPFFTYLFIIIQVAMFLFLEWKGGSTNTSTLIEYGAKFNPLILEGEWWRFFTPIFLHIGLLHLLMNTLALYYLGTTVERIYGNVRFLFIYLLAGFFGSLLSFIFSPNLSAGASGAIFGCFGALLYFGVIYPKLFFRTMGLNIIVILGINLVFGFTMPSIDNAGHIGGLIGGFVATGIVHFPKKKRLLIQAVSIIIAAVSIAGLLKYGFNEPGRVLNEHSALVMAQEYMKTEEYDKVLNILQKYDNDDSSSAELYFLLSYAEIKTNEIAKAKEHLHLAIEKRNDFHEAYYNLALLYVQEENFTEAQKFVRIAVDLMPDQQDYQKLLQQINEQVK